jgi:pimeloyl-ACP methyl ester carboxylesterase
LSTLHRLALAVLVAAACALGCSDTAGEAEPDAAGLADAGNSDVEQSGATARYDVDAALDDWHALPFPNELRRTATGTVDLGGFPLARDTNDIPDLVEEFIRVGGETLDGWPSHPTVYVAFDAPLDPQALPSPAETRSDNGAVMLVDVDPQSSGYGERIALDVQESGPEGGQHLRANLLMAMPLWGIALRPATTYAFIVRRSLRDGAGLRLGQPSALADALSAEPTTAAGQTLAAAYQPLKDAIGAGVVPAQPQDLAAATVFRTGDPVGALRDMAAWSRQSAPVSDPGAWQDVGSDGKPWRRFDTTYVAPNFQSGDAPYDGLGTGGFVFDDAGAPVPQREETLRVCVLIPNNRALADDGKLPVVLYAHGTGGNFCSFSKGSNQNVAELLTSRGLAVVGIDQPLHGPRTPVALTDIQLYLKTFNFLNPTSGQSIYRQSALDTVFLTRMVREGRLDVPGDRFQTGKPAQLDPQRVLFMGHSQGGLSGAIVAAIEPGIRSYVLSGAGAGLSLTIMQRKDVTDLSALVTGLFAMDPGELSIHHPGMSLVQTLVDVTDPLSYARGVFDRDEGVRPPDILLTEGMEDEATPPDTSESLAVAMGLELIEPVAHESAAMALLASPRKQPPVAQNRLENGFPVTVGVAQYPGGSHWVVFERADVAERYADFLSTSAETGVAYIQ